MHKIFYIPNFLAPGAISFMSATLIKQSYAQFLPKFLIFHSIWFSKSRSTGKDQIKFFCFFLFSKQTVFFRLSPFYHSRFWKLSPNPKFFSNSSRILSLLRWLCLLRFSKVPPAVWRNFRHNLLWRKCEFQRNINHNFVFA